MKDLSEIQRAHITALRIFAYMFLAIGLLAGFAIGYIAFGFEMTEEQKLEGKLLPYCMAEIEIPAFNLTCWEMYGGPVN